MLFGYMLNCVKMTSLQHVRIRQVCKGVLCMAGDRTHHCLEHERAIWPTRGQAGKENNTTKCCYNQQW
jgi:hypothetical protein